jgi:uncharacterized UPF0160 family protein
MVITYLITHSAGFHADELLSSVLLTHLFPKAELLRSRDRLWVTPTADRIIYDVGEDYDAAEQIFDHHQTPIPLRDDGKPFSSFGLIWAYYGRKYLAALDVPENDIEGIHTTFDTNFVLPIDLVDNGAMEPSVAGPLAIMTLPALFASLKPVFDNTSPTANDDAFFQRCQLPAALSKRQSKI